MGDYIRAQSEGVREVKLKLKRMKQFVRQVETCERKWPDVIRTGVFKMIPESQWSSNQANFKDVNHQFRIQIERLEPCVDPNVDDCFILVIADGQETTKDGFQSLAMKAFRQPDPEESGYDTITQVLDRRANDPALPVISGTVLGSRFSNAAEGLDCRNIGSVLEILLVHNGRRRNIHGVTTPRIDYGSYRSITPMKMGYMGLYTLAYNHAGKPRVYYVVNTNNVRRLENALKNSYRNDFVERGLDHCANPLQHLNQEYQRQLWAVKPSFFTRHNIEYSTVVQQVGEIVVMLPKAYYMCADLGYNIIESVSFATPRWIDIGKSLFGKMCRCRPVLLNPDDLDAAKVEYDRRREAERKNARLRTQVERLQNENEELQQNDGAAGRLPQQQAPTGSHGAASSSAPMAKRSRH